MGPLTYLGPLLSSALSKLGADLQTTFSDDGTEFRVGISVDLLGLSFLLPRSHFFILPHNLLAYLCPIVLPKFI